MGFNDQMADVLGQGCSNKRFAAMEVEAVVNLEKLKRGGPHEMGSRFFMNAAIFWNCRGLGSASSINSLHSLVRKYSPKLLFLSETKSTSSEIKLLQNKLNYDKSCCFEAIGKAGGLAVLWLDDIDVNVQGTDEHHIDIIVRSEGRIDWRLTCVYGWPENGQKYKTWDTINRLGADNVFPGWWVVISMKCFSKLINGEACRVTQIILVLFVLALMLMA